MAKKVRLDQLLVQRGLAETRARAQALILAGEVRVNGVVRHKAGELVPDDAEVELIGALPYVSRGGYKLAHALDTFALSPANLAAIDVGASTGGFTDVLLQRGAARVYAVDVGYGQLDWRLRQDPRVIVLERTNIRYLEALPPLEGEEAAAPVLADCAVIDVSFISLKLVLPAVQRLIRPDAWIVALIKPQFEAGPAQVGKGGVVRDPAVHAAVLRDVLTFSAGLGLSPHGLTRSPITGPAGNVEFLAWLGGSGPALDVERAIAEAVT
ncbi:MAG: TlyA family RNA methyltransferase [Roseiflexaceae bacterium]|nr:TlyA family RNA methyltransferase [Roseiflexaceae bacterium]